MGLAAYVHVQPARVHVLVYLVPAHVRAEEWDEGGNQHL